MMNESLALVLAGVAGGVLGATFFGGLWLTVNRALRSSHPARWFLGSLLLRTSIVLAGFYLIGLLHWQRIGACLFGFIIARFVMLRILRPVSEHPASKQSARKTPARKTLGPSHAS
jgi:F1F0 ATPase subunit 2